MGVTRLTASWRRVAVGGAARGGRRGKDEKAAVATATVATAVRAAAADVDERNFIPSSAFSIEW